MAIEAEFEIGSSIPVLRMLDEAEAREFYLDFLGYKIDWEHRFQSADEHSPLYMQIQMGGSVLHLDGHADEGAPVSEVRVPVVGLEAYWKSLCAKARSTRWEAPEVVDPRYEGKKTDMNIDDPSGNRLVFWARDVLG